MNSNINRANERALRLARRRQGIAERYEALDDICLSLRFAIEGLRGCEAAEACPEHEDDLAALEDIAAGLARDREAAGAQLQRLDALERAAMEREYRRETL